MNFVSNVLNSIPVVGHVKAGIHYLAGDEEGGHRAMYQSTRTSAVMAGGAAGLVLGPAGAAVGAAYGGLATDLLASGVSGKPQGLVQNCESVGNDIAAGRNPMGSIASTGFQIALDGVGGLGMGSVSSAATQISEKAVANSIQNVGKKVVSTVGEKALQKTFQVSTSEVTKAIGKAASEKVVKQVIKQTAIAAEVALVSTHVAKTARNQTEKDDEEERRQQVRRDRERQEQREREEREQRERERREREERERRANEERERRERLERERRANEEREQRERQERERRANEERERRERLERERRANEEREQRERQERERRANEERERRERLERERRANEEREQRERQERERRANEERERRERLERERRANEEREQRERQERERRANEERERRERLERERRANEEREQRERQERERQANEERELRERLERERRANEEREQRERQERERRANEERELRQRRECERQSTEKHGSQRNNPSQTSQGNRNTATGLQNNAGPKITANQQVTSQETSSGSSQPPQGNRNNNNNNKKKRKTDQEILDEFLQLLQRLLRVIYGSDKEIISAMFSKSKLAKHRTNFIKVLRTLKNFDTLEAVLETVIKIFKDHMAQDICFENFLSLLEFVRAYLNEKIDEIQTESTRYTEGTYEERRARILLDIRNEENLVEDIVTLFQQLKAEINVEGTAPRNIASYFRDIFTKLYNYYEQKRITEQQEQNTTNQQATNTGSVQPPQENKKKNNNKKKKQKTDQQVLDEFLQLLQRLLHDIYGSGEETISAMFSKSELAANETCLTKVLRTLENFDIMEAVLETVIIIFKDHMTSEISFENLLSLLKFVRSYLNDKINKVQTESTRYTEGSYQERRAQILCDIRSEEDLVEDIVALLVRLIVPDFRDIFAKVYHYYKHRRIPDLPDYEQENIQVPDEVREFIPEDGILSVRQYFYWARELIERLMNMPRYQAEVENQPPPITSVYEIYMELFGYRFRVVVKVRPGPGGIPVLVTSTVFIDDRDYEGDAENGYENLDIQKK